MYGLGTKMPLLAFLAIKLHVWALIYVHMSSYFTYIKRRKKSWKGRRKSFNSGKIGKKKLELRFLPLKSLKRFKMALNIANNKTN